MAKKEKTEQEQLSDRLKERIDFWKAIGNFEWCERFMAELKEHVDTGTIPPVRALNLLDLYAQAADEVQNFSDAGFYRYVRSYFEGLEK